MRIEQQSDQIVIAHLPGDAQLAEELQTLLGMIVAHPAHLILDFAAVRYLNSSHIAKLLKLRKLAIAADRRLILCAIDPPAWTAFTATGLDKIYEFTDTIPAAQTLLTKP